MIVVLASWLLLFAFFWVTGSGFVKLLNKLFDKPDQSNDVFKSLWLGIIITFFWLSLFHLFFPINYISWLFGIGFFLLSFFYVGSSILKKFLTNLLLKLNFRLFAISFVSVLMLMSFSYFASHVPVWPDTYLYHFNAVSWINNFAIVPGLANLHIRFGIQSGFFNFAAFLNSGLFWGNGVHLANSFLTAMLFIHLVYILFAPKTFFAQKVFSAVILPFIIAKGWGVEISSFSTDLVMSIFYILFNIYLLGQDLYKKYLLLLIALVLFTLKISGVIPLLCWGLYYYFNRENQLDKKKELLLYSFTILFCLLVYSVTNIIVTGWILFPIAIFGIPFDWMVPAKTVINLREDITAWAKFPGPAYRSSLTEGFLYWFIPWYKGFKQVLEYRLFLYSFIGIGIAGYVRKNLGDLRDTYVGLMIGTLSLCFWFISAPDVRFGSVFFWCIFSLSLVFIFQYVDNINTKLASVLLYLFSFIFTLYITTGPSIDMGLLLFSLPRPSFVTVQKYEFMQDDKKVFFWRSIAPSDICGDSPLPCTPYPSDQIIFRDVNDLGKGFRLR